MRAKPSLNASLLIQGPRPGVRGCSLPLDADEPTRGSSADGALDRTVAGCSSRQARSSESASPARLFHQLQSRPDADGVARAGGRRAGGLEPRAWEPSRISRRPPPGLRRLARDERWIWAFGQQPDAGGKCGLGGRPSCFIPFLVSHVAQPGHPAIGRNIDSLTHRFLCSAPAAWTGDSREEVQGPGGSPSSWPSGQVPRSPGRVHVRGPIWRSADRRISGHDRPRWWKMTKNAADRDNSDQHAADLMAVVRIAPSTSDRANWKLLL
jgi:hypothetical protein